MEKRKYIPFTVYEAIARKLKITHRAVKERVYRGDLTLLTMIETELEKDKKKRAQKAKDREERKAESKKRRQQLLTVN